MSGPQLFFAVDYGAAHSALDIGSPFTWQLWRPSAIQVRPPQTALLPFGVWWAFHSVGLFGNRDYCIFCAFDRERLVHRSCIFPGYFRFPFMERADLQVGDTWTDDDYRGQGLATFALRRIVVDLAIPERRFWYIVAASNESSIRVAQKAGFRLVGRGTRTRRLGLRLLGAFQLDSEAKARGTSTHLNYGGPNVEANIRCFD